MPRKEKKENCIVIFRAICPSFICQQEKEMAVDFQAYLFPLELDLAAETAQETTSITEVK